MIDDRVMNRQCFESEVLTQQVYYLLS